MNKENVKGLIIDVRNNGGGSLIDAVKIAGLFIDKGPIVQVKTREGSPYIFEDKDERINFSKPLIILTNIFSASASEILAAAMQDYGRAVIVGDVSTYGKGTVQSFTELDKLTNDNRYKPLGSIKITIQKFYRINGGATQLKGVIPDIILPNIYNYISDIGEKELEYVMPWSEIDKLPYNKWTSSYKISSLRMNSDKRVSRDSVFLAINDAALRLKQQKDQTKVTLSIDDYRKTQNKIKEDNKRLEEIQKREISGFKVKYLSDEMNEIENDTIKKSKFENWAKDIRKDVYIKECVNILKDINR